MKETLTILRLLGKLLVQLPGKMMKKVRTGRSAAVYGYVNLYRLENGSIIQTVMGSRFPYASLERALEHRCPSMRYCGQVWKYWKTQKVRIS